MKSSLEYSTFRRGKKEKPQITIIRNEREDMTNELTEIKKIINGGAWVAQSVKPLPLAQIMIPGFWDPAWSGSLLSGKTASPSPTSHACVPSLAVSIKINK